MASLCPIGLGYNLCLLMSTGGCLEPRELLPDMLVDLSNPDKSVWHREGALFDKGSYPDPPALGEG